MCLPRNVGMAELKFEPCSPRTRGRREFAHPSNTAKGGAPRTPRRGGQLQAARLKPCPTRSEGFTKGAKKARESYAEICARPEHVVGGRSSTFRTAGRGAAGVP